jgi:hypothetical protein
METRAHFNEEASLSGEMSVRFDVSTGKIFSYGSGFWSVRQTIAFFEDWRHIVRRVHAADQSISALVDMSESDIQKVEVADIIARATAGMYRHGDAIAMLVPTSLSKMQMRRVLDERFHGFFTARGVAEMWLDARARVRMRSNVD